MQRSVAVFLCLIAGLLVAADAPKQDGSKDKEKLPGTWKVTSITVNGKVIADPKEFKNMEWEITADKIKWSYGPEFLYKLRPTAQPSEMDLIFPENPTEITPGIYSLKDDDLKVIIGKENAPTDFTADAGSRRFLYVMKRVKKK